LGFQH